MIYTSRLNTKPKKKKMYAHKTNEKKKNNFKQLYITQKTPEYFENNFTTSRDSVDINYSLKISAFYDYFHWITTKPIWPGTVNAMFFFFPDSSPVIKKITQEIKIMTLLTQRLDKICYQKSSFEFTIDASRFVENLFTDRIKIKIKKHIWNQ